MSGADLYPGSSEPSKTQMTEEQEIKAGRTLAYGLKLRRDVEHKDRWRTEWGSKTDLGLWRTVVRMVDELRKEAISS